MAKPRMARCIGLQGDWATRCARPVRVCLSVLLIAAVFAPGGCRPEPTAPSDERALPRTDAVTGLLQGSSDGFAVADRIRPMQFPDDHAPHVQYRTEWWYFTGHLRTEVAQAENSRRGDVRRGATRRSAERWFGFQYTVFRQALRPPDVLRPPALSGATSAWRSDTAWLAHLALTDIQRGEHSGHARIARGALGLGGLVPTSIDAAGHKLEAPSTRGTFAIMVDGWRLQRAADGAFLIDAESATGAGAGAGSDAGAGVAGATEAGAIGLQLRLVPLSAPVLHGQQGWSRKGPSSASYYFSIPRWQVTGKVRTTTGEWLQVRGDGWLDREWSTSALAPEQVGWDWFSLNLGRDPLGRDRELMLFRLRRSDGRPDPFNSGTLVTAGVARVLRAGDFSVIPVDFWQDEAGRHWPVSWTVTLRQPALRLRVKAVLPDQLMRVGLVYWEGAVSVDGDAKGRGYLEMTGYAPHARR